MANPITPETRVHLLNVPLENNLKNTLWFANENSQSTYFLSKAVQSNVDFTYQRKDKTMVVPYLVDNLYTCNYVMYQNHNFNNKWFYAFITNMEYVDEETTRLYLETDPIQTWFFEMEVKQSFVEREHAKIDTIGANLQPEELELGDYIINNIGYDTQLLTLNIILASSKQPYGNLDDVYAQTYNGIFSGVRYYSYSNKTDAIAAINNLARTPEAIQTIFLAPSFMSQTINDTPEVLESDITSQHDFTINKITTLNGYTPKNKKMLTYPYCFIKVSNFQGQTGIYKQEFFELTNTASFTIQGVLCPGCSIRLFPKLYNGEPGMSAESGINLAKYPICSWSSDSYINWLTQNGLSNAVGTAVGTAGIIAGGIGLAGATGGASLIAAGLMLVGGVAGVTNSLHQFYVAELQPPQVAGNTNCGDVMTASENNTFAFITETIRYNQARIIDKYFDMFGYKTNLVKVPETNHRANWWYTKTIDANIVGDIPENDMERIRQCYNEGITFWKNPANMYNYDVDNSIVNNS